MTRATKAAFAGALLCGLLGLTLISLYFDWLTWAATPHGKNAITWVTFVALAGWLISVAVRDAQRKRLSREAQEWDAIDEWEEAMELRRAQKMWRDVGEDILDEAMTLHRDHVRWQDDVMKDIRRVSRADMDAEADRIEAELRTNAMPQAVREWPQPLSPRLTDYATSAPAPAPLPMRYYLGDPKPMAAADSYTGAAAWTAESFRSGRPLPTDVLDAIVPVSGGPRHAWGSNRGTDMQRTDPAFVAWEENTGAWPVITRELINA
jgi:hypothetical protein